MICRVTDISKGPGVHRARTKVINDAISQGKPFNAITRGIKDTFGVVFATQKSTLIRNATEVFDRILRDFDLNFVVKEIKNPQRDQLRREMSAFVAEAKEEIDQNIMVELSRAETETANEC